MDFMECNLLSSRQEKYELDNNHENFNLEFNVKKIMAYTSFDYTQLEINERQHAV